MLARLLSVPSPLRSPRGVDLDFPLLNLVAPLVAGRGFAFPLAPILA